MPSQCPAAKPYKFANCDAQLRCRGVGWCADITHVLQCCGGHHGGVGVLGVRLCDARTSTGAACLGRRVLVLMLIWLGLDAFCLGRDQFCGCVFVSLWCGAGVALA